MRVERSADDVTNIEPTKTRHEVPGAPAEPYQMLTFDRSGETGVCATR